MMQKLAPCFRGWMTGSCEIVSRRTGKWHFWRGCGRPVKAARCVLSPHLFHFQKQTGAEHAFQAVLDLPHEDIDCFAHRAPVIVPLRTLLSQFP